VYPLYGEVNSLDRRCEEEYKIPEIVMMENAALALSNAVRANTPKGSKVLIVCGPGNNGADGLACARQLMDSFEVYVFMPLGVKSTLAKMQFEIIKSLHVNIVDELKSVKTVVDALFGSGGRVLDVNTRELVATMNNLDAFKIACDLPTGIGLDDMRFKADITVTMGALKTALYGEDEQDCVGEIIVGDLGIPRNLYEIPSNTFLLDKTDMRLPVRKKANVHKGNFGHLLLLGGQKSGACILAADAGFGFGAGLVSVWGQGRVPAHIMQTNTLPVNTTAIVAGMGMGEAWSHEELREILCKTPHPLVLDADLCAMEITKECLKLHKPIVITPHPKEFAALLFTCKGKKLSVAQIQENRIELAREFSIENDAVLVLKGSHTIVAHKGDVYLCAYSEPSLAKGGSGDVLSGMIGALLAQGYEAKEAAITSVLAHVLAAISLPNGTYALTPQALIEGVKCLSKE
jgi:hydroxyethylthiazole kinase-like uncharacterized protein yjeF